MTSAHIAAAPLTPVAAARSEADDTPARLDTYALSYAFGIVWLAVAMILLGTRPLFAFDGLYDALLVLPPFATAACVLLADHRGQFRTLALRTVLLATVAGVVSVLSTVVLTPFLVLMFREGVGWNLGLTGTISAVTLVAVASPMLIVLVTSVRRGTFGRAAIMVAGLAVTGVVLAMALAPGGPVASLMRLDQAEITMITASWWLPVYALAAAVSRRLGVA
jgi:hypothetical protein